MKKNKNTSYIFLTIMLIIVCRVMYLGVQIIFVNDEVKENDFFRTYRTFGLTELFSDEEYNKNSNGVTYQGARNLTVRNIDSPFKGLNTHSQYGSSRSRTYNVERIGNEGNDVRYVSGIKFKSREYSIANTPFNYTGNSLFGNSTHTKSINNQNVNCGNLNVSYNLSVDSVLTSNINIQPGLLAQNLDLTPFSELNNQGAQKIGIDPGDPPDGDPIPIPDDLAFQLSLVAIYLLRKFVGFYKIRGF